MGPGRAPTFTAIDFETANCSRNSACAVGLVRVEKGHVVKRAAHLIRPPSRIFEFTHIHGLAWHDVRRAQTFGSLWPEIAPFLKSVDFVAAHNAPFDRGVLEACCAWYDIALPRIRYECTVALARRTWGLRPTTLPDVAAFLGLTLDHHEAGSDAEACARIVLAAAA